MRTHYFLLAITLFISSCLSETEEKGVTEISELYGCNVSYSKGISAATGEETKKVLEMELSGGKNLDLIDAKFTATNAAVIMYDNLAESEKAKYTHIKCAVMQNSNDRTEVECAMADLQKYSQKKLLFYDCATFIGNGDYQLLFDNFATEITENVNKDYLINYLDSLKEVNGSANGSRILGFSKVEAEMNNNQYTLIAIDGLIMNENEPMYLKIMVSQDDQDDKIYGMNF